MKINSGEIIIILSIILVCYFLINLCNKSFEGFDGLPTCQRLTNSCNDVTSINNLSYSCCNAIMNNENKNNPNEYCAEVEDVDRFPLYNNYKEICSSALLQTLSPCDYENTNSINYEKKSLGMRDPILDYNRNDYGKFKSCECNIIHTGDNCSTCLDGEELSEAIGKMTLSDFIKISPDNECLKETYAIDVNHSSIFCLTWSWIRNNISDIMNEITDWANYNKYPTHLSIKNWIEDNSHSMIEWVKHNPRGTIGIYVAGTAIRGAVFTGLVGWWKDYRKATSPELFRGISGARDAMPSIYGGAREMAELDKYAGGALWRTFWNEGAEVTTSVLTRTAAESIWGAGWRSLISPAVMAGRIVGTPIIAARAGATAIRAGAAALAEDPLAVAGAAAVRTVEFGVEMIVISVISSLVMTPASIVNEAGTNILISVALGQCENKDLCDCVTDWTGGSTITLQGDSKPLYAEIFWGFGLDTPIQFKLGDDVLTTEPGHGLHENQIKSDGSWSIDYDLSGNIPMSASGNPLERWYCS